MTYGIDVSENNGRVDWQAVADAGQKFAIVRSSYGRTGEDEEFLRNPYKGVREKTVVNVSRLVKQKNHKLVFLHQKQTMILLLR